MGANPISATGLIFMPKMKNKKHVKQQDQLLEKGDVHTEQRATDEAPFLVESQGATVTR